MLCRLLSCDALQLGITGRIRRGCKMRGDHSLKNFPHGNSGSCSFGKEELFCFLRNGQSHAAILSQTASQVTRLV